MGARRPGAVGSSATQHSLERRSCMALWGSAGPRGPLCSREVSASSTASPAASPRRSREPSFIEVGYQRYQAACRGAARPQRGRDDLVHPHVRSPGGLGDRSPEAALWAGYTVCISQVAEESSTHRRGWQFDTYAMPSQSPTAFLRRSGPSVSAEIYRLYIHS